MKKRVTIVLDDDLIRKVRVVQAKMILKNLNENKERSSYSFSKVVNDLIRKALK